MEMASRLTDHDVLICDEIFTVMKEVVVNATFRSLFCLYSANISGNLGTGWENWSENHGFMADNELSSLFP
jgi:hypothetical protein